jgi:GH25 family lysozyme M1 (1,4-beta-N-acetylmuramidase)
MTWIFGIDSWEGNLIINEPELKLGGVSFLIPRMNSISGALHMDDTFLTQWAEAEPFIHFPYYVYTPYSPGAVNWAWLKAHLPAGVKRIAVDIEVKRPDYPAWAYAAQVYQFLDDVQMYGLKPVIYTGAWFLDTLDSWPAYVEYWWARYPYALYPPDSQRITWAELRVKLDALGWNPACTTGTCHLWQCSGDRYKLPGMNDRVADINVWDGTLNELRAWVGDNVEDEPTLEEKVEALWIYHPELHP